MSHKTVLTKFIGIPLSNDFVWNLFILIRWQGKRKFSIVPQMYRKRNDFTVSVSKLNGSRILRDFSTNFHTDGNTSNG